MPTDRTTAGDRFLALLRPLERELEVYARRLIWDPSQVRDALHNAVMRAFAAFDRYRPAASFRAWMFRILTREVFALNRRYARIARFECPLDPQELETLAAPCVGASEADGGVELKALEPGIARALQTLTETERAVLLLRAVGELRYREIAEALAVPLGTVMGSLSRARQKMRVALSGPFRSPNHLPQTTQSPHP